MPEPIKLSDEAWAILVALQEGYISEESEAEDQGALQELFDADLAFANVDGSIELTDAGQDYDADI